MSPKWTFSDLFGVLEHQCRTSRILHPPMDVKHAPQCLFPGPVEASDSTTMPDTEVTCADAEPKKNISENVALIIAVQTEESHDRAWYRHTVANVQN